MKPAGFVRKVDELGRIVLPHEFRAKLNINKKENVEMYKKQDCIFIHKTSNKINEKEKNPSISRKTDDLGRIVIPKEWRDELGIEFREPVEIALDNKMIIVKKYNPYCLFCGEKNKLSEYKEKKVCSQCIERLNEIKNSYE